MLRKISKYCLQRLLPVIVVGLSLQPAVFAQDSGYGQAPGMPEPRLGMCSARIGNTVYFIGGAQSLQYGNLQDVRGTCTVQSFNFDTMSWDTLAPLETPRVFACAVATEDSIYVMGGVDNHGNVLNSVEVYAPATNKWHYTARMEFGRKGAAATVLDGHVFVFGGGDSLNVLHREVEEYTPEDGSWSVLHHLTYIGRAFHHVATIGNSIYIFGGVGATIGPVSLIERYIPGEGVVGVKLRWNSPRYLFGSVIRSDSIFVISGYGNQSSESGYYSDVDVFDFRNPDSATEGVMNSELQTARRGFVAALGPNGDVYLFGGISPGWKRGQVAVPWVSTLEINTASATAVSEERNSVPSGFKLDQNYPNPFNPTTVISFGVPAPGSRVNLRIYNMLGQRVRTLLDGYFPPGIHSVTFDGANLTSGAYIYRLETENGSIYRKMVLIK